MSLAAKLPYDHGFSGGFPGLGGQALPTDSDCLTYLAAVKAADGAGVETGVAVAVDAFFRDLKATPGLFDAIKASCILCGARTLSGALVPLVGSAPTNNNFVSADYNRETGLVSDGSTKYINTNRSINLDAQDDCHVAGYASEGIMTIATTVFTTAGAVSITSGSANIVSGRLRSSIFSTANTPGIAPTFFGASRDSSNGFTTRGNGQSDFNAIASVTNNSLGNYQLQRYYNNYTVGRMAFYSAGSSIDLAALDDAVSTLVTAIGAAI